MDPLTRFGVHAHSNIIKNIQSHRQSLARRFEHNQWPHRRATLTPHNPFLEAQLPFRWTGEQHGGVGTVAIGQLADGQLAPHPLHRLLDLQPRCHLRRRLDVLQGDTKAMQATGLMSGGGVCYKMSGTTWHPLNSSPFFSLQSGGILQLITCVLDIYKLLSSCKWQGILPTNISVTWFAQTSNVFHNHGNINL